MNRPRMFGYGSILSLAWFAGYVALATGCGKSEPAAPVAAATPPEPQDRFSLAMLGQWSLLAVQPRSLVLEGFVQFGNLPPQRIPTKRMTDLTVTCSSTESCDFHGSGTGTDVTNYCKGTVTLANGSLMVEVVPDAAAREANVSGGRPAPEEYNMGFCSSWTGTYARGPANEGPSAIGSSSTSATGSSGTGGGNNGCMMRCATAQSACVLRCNGMRSCISECGAKSMECVGGC